MVECTALEMRHTGNRIEGSNPSLSAIKNPLKSKILSLLTEPFGVPGSAWIELAKSESHDRGAFLLLDFGLQCDLNAC